MANEEKPKSVFYDVLQALRGGRDLSSKIGNNKGLIADVPKVASDFKSNNIQQKQQDFLDMQSVKIAHDIYSRSVYYDSDRISAYQDYKAMDHTPEIAAALDILTDECLEASTIIPLLDGKKKTIEELYNEKAENFFVYSYNIDKKCSEQALCERAIYKGEQNVYKIIFDDNSDIMATKEHLWLSELTKKYIKTSNLKRKDYIQGFGDKISGKNKHIKHIKCVGKRKTYDLVNVGEFHNYAVLTSNGTGVICHNCVTKSDRGEILTIYSDNLRVKGILRNFFDNTLNVNYNLGLWIRELLKYGDTFLKLEIDQTQGVYDVRMLPVAEIHREEAWDGNVNSAKFKWDINNMYFEEFQMAHFRLFTDGSRMPYGRSILDAARKLWKQLQLAEDAMLTYRILRAPDRRVYYIEVGNLPAEDVSAYIDKIKRETKKSPIVDQKTGNVNLKYNPMPIWKNTPIPLLDGRTITIEEIAKEYESGKQNYVYSIQDKTHKIVPGKIVWCGKNYTAEKLTKVWLDDNTWVLTAPEHPFMLRNGEFVRADELKEGDSLMPYYEGEKILYRKSKYKTVYDPCDEKYNFAHRLIARDISKKNIDYNTVHHYDFDKNNQNPENLIWVDFHEHKTMHSELAKKMWENPEYKAKMAKICSDFQKENWKNKEYRENHIEKVSKTLQKKWSNGELEHVREIAKNNIIKYNKSDAKLKRVSELNIERNSVQHMSWYNNSDLHKEHDEIRRQSLSGRWNNLEEKEKLTKSMTTKTNRKCFDIIVEEIKKYNEFVNSEDFIKSLINSELFLILKELNKGTKRENKIEKFFHKTNLRRILRENGIDNYKEFLKLYNPILLDKKREKYSISTTKMNTERGLKNLDIAEYKNHKVLRIETIYENEDVYCMTVVGLNREDDRHNFALYSFDENDNCSKSGIFVRNTIEEDFYVPIRGDRGSRIETLQGAANMNDIEDVEYLQNKLFAALKVPKTYLNYNESMPGGSTLSQADLRFSRTVNRIQEAVVVELRRIATIHLHFLGFDDDLENFTLSLTNPSSQQELLKLETMKARMEVFKEMFTNEVTSPVSYTWAMEFILGFSKSEIKQILRQKKVEKKMFSEIEGAVDEYKETGFFGEIDKKFRKPGYVPPSVPKAEGEEGTASGGGGDSFGGGSSLTGLGGGAGSMESGAETTPEEGVGEPGAEGAGTPELGGEAGAPPEKTGAEVATPPAEEGGEEELKETNLLLNKNKAVNIRTKKLLESIERSLKKSEDENETTIL